MTRIWIPIAVLLLALAARLVQVYGAFHHPYLPALSLLLFGAAILYVVGLAEKPPTERERALYKVFEGIGEALVVVAAVVVLFELPDFKEFYERSIREILTTRAYVEKLSSDEQRDIVESVVLSRLGRSVDSAVGRAYTLDLYHEIDEGQYVASDERYFEKSWTGPERDSMKVENRMTRHVRVFGQQATHRLNDYVAGQFVYWVVVDKVVCLEIANNPATRTGPPVRSQAPALRNTCSSRITDQARGHIIKVDIPLTRGEHVIQRVISRKERGAGTLSTSFTLGYFTQSLSLKYHYPPQFVLEAIGDGDLEPYLAGLSPVNTPQSDQIEFDQTFQDGWFGRGAGAALLLSPNPDSVAAMNRAHAGR